MPSLGLGLSLGSSNPKPGFDPDAWGYISANNILNSAIIDDFDSNANSAGFVGTGRLQVTTTNFNITSTDDFSWGGWVFFTNASNNHFPFGFGNNNKFYWMSNTLYWEWGSINVGLSSYSAKTTNTWYHIFMTTSRSGGSQTHKIYVNGSVVNTQTSSVTHSMSNPTFYVGGATSTEYLEGRVDGVCLFKRTLSDADVTWLYNSGKGRRYTDAVADSKTSNLLAWYELDETSGSRADASGNGNTLTINGTGVTFKRGVIPFRTLAINPQTQINTFVKEIKNLNLWADGVFWLLRNFQNTSSGTSVNSIGGLGSYAGSVSGGVTLAPTKTPFGSYVDGTATLYAGYRFAGLNYNYNQNGSFFMAGKLADNTPTTDVFVRVWGSSGGQPASALTLGVSNVRAMNSLETWSGAQYSGATFTAVDSTDNFNFYGVSIDFGLGSNQAEYQLNSSFGFSNRTAHNNSIGQYLLVGQNVANSWKGHASFACYFTSVVSQANKTNLYNLVKSTLGVGLGWK